MEGEEGFTAFFREQFPQVVAGLIGTGGFPRQIAEDAVSEAMTRLLLDYWDKVHAPRAWVRVVAVRLAGQMAKAQHAALPPTELIDSKAKDDLTAVELALATGSVIDALPPRQRQVMVLTIADMKPEEIAHELGCTPEQARSNLAHARRTMRRTLGPEEEA